MYKLILSFGIYSYFFTTLGNTIFRKDDKNNVNFSIIPLITTGFTSPIKTIINLLSLGEYKACYNYFIFETTNLANPYTSYYFVTLIEHLISSNFTNFF